MMKLTRAQTLALQGKKAKAAPVVASDPMAGMKEFVGELAQAMQESSAQTQRALLAMTEAKVEPVLEVRPVELVADIERDADGHMMVVNISDSGDPLRGKISQCCIHRDSEGRMEKITINVLEKATP